MEIVCVGTTFSSRWPPKKLSRSHRRSAFCVATPFRRRSFACGNKASLLRRGLVGSIASSSNGLGGLGNHLLILTALIPQIGYRG